MLKQYITRCSTLLATTVAVLFSIPAQAVDLNLSTSPLFVSSAVAPLNMLVIGRDHKLYYEAYNDYSDLNEDGVLDLKYKPTQITYYGYFDSYKCYQYSSGDRRFNPNRAVPNRATKACGGNNEWSGDFLNYLTTSRIDALRKVLYGGYRSTDTASATVLERTFLPQDAHGWGKEYKSVAVDGYDISQYSPYSIPGTGRHFFANTTLLGTTEPLLRVLEERSERIWNWVSIERPVAGSRMNNGTNGPLITPAPTDYAVRVAVCVNNLREPNCQAYGDSYKPIGLLQEFGENKSMYFGLITGSYSKNTSGGVLRQRMDAIGDEINANGTFKTAADDAGVIASLNRLKVTGFGGNYQYDCGFTFAATPIGEGDCQMWGNPIAEMMYEGMRYFAGLARPTAAFDIAFGAGEESELEQGGLPVDSWDNPYSDAQLHPACAKPFQTVVSDINPSYDTDQLPGTAFGSFGGDLSGLNVSTLGQTIWNQEFSSTSKSVFIGQSGATSDGAPTPKTATSFGNIRGLSPEEPTKQGGYYAASVAYHGRVKDINPTATGPQNVQTFAVALASPLPRIEIPVANGRKVTLVPFAKSVAGSGISATAGDFQPTDQIVDFYVDTLTPTSGTFRVNFEDVEQGADHDMDAITVYEYSVVNNTVTVKLTSEYAFGGITQHMGYVISGTTRDGIYLDVLDRRDGDTANDTDYFLDTPQLFVGTPPAPQTGTGGWDDDGALPYNSTRTFDAGASTGAQVLKDPLWYAAKWGGFADSNDNDMPDLQAEWDADTSGVGVGTPDNYFLVTNALKLSDQLRQAFADILARSASATAASANGGSISTDTRVYQARFNTGDWSGELFAYRYDPQTERISTQPLWNAATVLPTPDNRKIFTVNSNNAAVPFLWASLDADRRTQLAATEATQKAYVNYLRGDATLEGTGAGALRRRTTSKLGDIVSSSPVYVQAPRARYSDSMPGTTPYSQFVATNRYRDAVVYVGANDGMLHAFDGGGFGPDSIDPDLLPDKREGTGQELFGFIPKAVFSKLKELPKPTYTQNHNFYVDGSPNSNDVFYGNAWHSVLVGGLNFGGQGIYALDVTNPTRLRSAEANAAGIYLWEFTDQNDADLGYTYSQPAIVRLQDGSWAAVFGNGYNNTVADGAASTTGNAVLYIVNIQTGALIRKLDTRVGLSTTNTKPNGLATPTMVDVDGDRIVDHAYAGDLLGNLWKFDLRSTNNAEWGFAFGTDDAPQPLFTATDDTGRAQPITVRPEVARGPFGAGVMVLFGTGKYLETSDKTIDPTVPMPQAFYGLVDDNTYAETDKLTKAQLVPQSITSETLVPDPDGPTGPLVARSIRKTSSVASNGNGFYLPLVSPSGYNGERQVTDPLVRGDRVIFTTLIPNSASCGFGGSSWLMILDLLSGGQLTQAQLDTDGDGDVDGNDQAASGSGADEIRARATSLVCVGSDCSADDDDRLLIPGSSGGLSDESTPPIGYVQGRQSWRQIR